MKLGKKALSCILAIMMIVTSISVCFNSFAALVDAESQLKNLYNQINMDYDGLTQAIKQYEEAQKTGEDEKIAAARRLVPYGQYAAWTVEQDTYHSGWYNVAKAYAAYAKSISSKTEINSYFKVYDQAMKDLEKLGNNNDIDLSGESGATLAEVDSVLSFFKFGTDESTPISVSVNRTLTIKPGINYFAWSSIDDIETDRNYYQGELSFNLNSGFVPNAITFAVGADDSEDINTKLGSVKSVLKSMVDENAFQDWFTWNFAEKSVEEIQTLVDGEGSAANILEAFDLAAKAAGFTDGGKALWDHYVKDIVGKSFADTTDWINNELKYAIYQAYGSSYRKQFNDIMADYDNSTAEKVLEHYNDVIALQNKFLDQRDPTRADVVISSNILPWLNGDDEFYNVTVLNYIAKHKVDVAKAYAAKYAVDLSKLIAEADELPTYDKNDSAAAEKWNGSPDQAKVRDYIGRATTMLKNIDDYILAYGTYDDIANTFAGGKRITKDDYDALKAKIDAASIDADGFSEFANKADMDSFMATTIFEGRSYTALTNYYSDFKALLANAEKLRDDETSQALYNTVYEEGLDKYSDYLASIKVAVVDRIYEQVARIEKYYNKAGKVTFYNFEAILAAYDALEVTEASLLTFLNEAPKYNPTGSQPTLTNISKQYENAAKYSKEAIDFKAGLDNLKIAANGSDINIMKYIATGGGSSYANYKWVSSVNKLNVEKITEIVNKVGLVNKDGSYVVKVTDIPNLMNAAVSDLDKILVSNDLGTVLDKLLATTDEETGETKGFLGQWKQTYTLDGVKHNKGTDIKNLREFLVNLIIDLLYNGKLLNTLFQLVYPAIGGAITNGVWTSQTVINAGTGLPKIYLQGLPGIIERGIPLVPHNFRTDYNNSVKWCMFYDGSHLPYNYNAVLQSTRSAKMFGNGWMEASQSLAVGVQAWKTTASYWSVPAAASISGTTATVPKQKCESSGLFGNYDIDSYTVDTVKDVVNWSYMNDIDAQELWHLDPSTPDTLYYALAAVFGGLGAVLRVALSGEQQAIESTVASIDVSLVMNGDNAYARLLEPLYQILGIPALSGNNHGYYPLSQIATDSECAKEFGDCFVIKKDKGYGKNLWSDILSPILYWMENTLFKNPVETILGILPNLLAAIEHNQILPKLKNIKIGFKALGIQVYELDLWSTLNLEQLLKDNGIILNEGINGLVNGLLGMTASKAPPVAGEKGVLMAYDKTANDGEGAPSETEVASYETKDNKTYYFTNCGLLAQTIYNLMGDGFIEWMFNKEVYKDKNSGNILQKDGKYLTSADIAKDYNTYKNTAVKTKEFIFEEGNEMKSGEMPLTLPVNRLLAAGKTMGTWSDDGGNTHYKLNVDKGTVLLEFLRWLMDDGAWYDVKALVESILPQPEGAEEGAPSVLDTVSSIIDGQADYISAVLICLLNAYGIDFTPYVDSAADYANGTTTAFLDKNGNPYIKKVNGEWVSAFELGSVLEDSLKATGTTDSNGNPIYNLTEQSKIAKASLAVDSLDKIIKSLFPMIITLLDGVLKASIKEQLDVLKFDEVVQGVKDGTYEDLPAILGKIFITNDFVNLIMGLLVGTHEMVEVKDKDDKVVLDEDGNPVMKKDVGLLGGLLGDSSNIIFRAFTILADFGIDLTPYGFYDNATRNNSIGKDGKISSWLINEADKFRAANIGNEKYKYTASTPVTTVLKDMTWADVGFDKNQEWFTSAGFDTYGHTKQTYTNFLTFLEHLLTSLNPLLCLLLTGEDITLLDRLTLQGNEGYSKAIIPIFEALGLDSAVMTQAEFNKFVYGATSSALNSSNNYAVKDKTKDSPRFYPNANSPLNKVFDALKTLLLGPDEAHKSKGLLYSPVAVLSENLPNIAYLLYEYKKTEKDENGNNVEVETNNLSVALQNLIAPVLKLLDIADPIIARLIKLDIRGLLNKYLDLETLLNDLLSQLLGSDKDNKENYIYSDMLDFGEIAAKSSSKINVTASTLRGGTFTKFEANKGQFLITLLRSVLNPQLVNMLGKLIADLFFQAGITSAAQVESQERILKIVNSITSKLNEPVQGSDNATKVDIIIGILIDLLTDYDSDKGIQYFYQQINDLDGNIDKAFEKYGVDTSSEELKDAKFNWEGYADTFPDEYKNGAEAEASVNSAITNIDYVIQKAVPDVIGALTEEGVLNLPFELSLNEHSTLWEIIEAVVNSALFNDNLITTIFNAVLGLLGSGNIDTGTMDLVLSVVKAAGFDITPSAYIKFNEDGTPVKNTILYSYISYGIDKDENGVAKIEKKGNTLYATIGGEEVELDWNQIYINHSFVGTPTADKDGKPQETRVIIASAYPRVKDDDGNYVYTYTDADGKEATYSSEIPDLTTFTDANEKEYALSIKYDETKAPAWSWGLDSISTGSATDDFTAKKSRFIDIVWAMISPFEELFTTLLAGDTLELFNGGLSLRGNNAYENVVLPLLNAFGLDAILEYVSKASFNEGGKTILQTINETKAPGHQINAQLMTADEYLKMVYKTNEQGKFVLENGKKVLKENGIRDAIEKIADYVFAFAEILLTSPISTLASALPTLAYFIVGDGLTTLVSNLLIPVTTLTNRLVEIVAIDVNGIGGGLLDVLSTGSFAKFQEALASVGTINEETGEIIINTDGNSNEFTKSLLKIIGGIEIDLKALVAEKDEDNTGKDYNYGILYFIDKAAEAGGEDENGEYVKGAHDYIVEAKGYEAENKVIEDKIKALEEDKETDNSVVISNLLEQSKELVDKAYEARNKAGDIRAAGLKVFFTRIVALGDTVKEAMERDIQAAKNGEPHEYEDYEWDKIIGGEILKKNADYVYVNSRGQVSVSKAEVLMWLLTFITENTVIREVLAGLNLGGSEGEEGSVQEMLNLDLNALINNVLDNPEVLVDVIVGLVTHYNVKENPTEIDYIDVVENHADFYEDLGYNSIEDVLAENEKNNGNEITELSRVHTKAAIDNLDKLVGSILNLTPIKNLLITEGGFLEQLGYTSTDKITLKGLVEKLLNTYACSDEMINKFVTLLVGALGSDANKQIVNIIFTIAEGAGYSLTPQTIKANIPELEDVIGEAKKWNQVAKNNEKFVYQYKEEGKDPVTLYSEDENATTIDGKAVTPVYVQKVDKDGNPVFEDADKKIPVYTDVRVKAVDITGIEWNVTNRDELISLVWKLLKPLSPIFEAILTGGNLTIYEKVNIRGLKGYKGIIEPLAEALAIDKLTDKDGNKYIKKLYTYDELTAALYNTNDKNGDGKISVDERTLKEDKSELLLTSITDIIFAFVDSLCDRPMSTLLTVLPYLARFIASDGIDVILENIISPVTAILEKIKAIYDLDVMGIVKNLLVGVIEKINVDIPGASDSLDPEDQSTITGATAAYILEKIEENDPSNKPVLANILSEDLLPAGELEQYAGGNVTFLEIIWNVLDRIKVYGSPLSNLIARTLFQDLASYVWLEGSMMPVVTIAPDGKSGQIDGSIPVEFAPEVKDRFVVDRESVLIKVLNTIIFTDEIRELIGKVANIDFDALNSVEKIDLADSNSPFIAALIYSVFSNPENTEKLIIVLLSWYNVLYKEIRTTKRDFKTELTKSEDDKINYNEAKLDKTQLDKLPSQLDSLIIGILPAVVDLLPEGALGSLQLKGNTLREIVENLLIGFLADSKDGKEGLATTLMKLLVTYAGGNPTVGMILSLVGDLIDGIDLSLKYFKESSPVLAAYFAGCETWEDAYNLYAVNVKYDADKEYKDAEGNVYTPKHDENGIYTEEKVPVMEKDADGNEVQKVDAEGNPVFEIKKVYEKEISFKNDSVKTDIPVMEKDADGKEVQKVDTEGNPVFESVKVYEYYKSFGVTDYASTLDFIKVLLTPLVPVLKVLLSEKDLIILDGVDIAAGDGYDRFLVPLLEVLGIQNVKDESGNSILLDKEAFNILDNAAYAAKIVEYIDAIIGRLLESPVEFVVDLIPQLLFFIYSDGLAQSVEQFIAPLLTLVDLVNDVLANKFNYKENENELYVLDVYEFIMGFINGNETMNKLLGNVKDIYDLVEKMLTREGLENVLANLLDDANKTRVENGEAPIDLGFSIKGDAENDDVLKMILKKCCTIADVTTVRHYGATTDKSGNRTVQGVVPDRADTLVGIISEVVLGGDLLKNLLGTFGVAVDGTVGTIIDAVTGENKYVIFQILLKYFNEYDVETMVLEYLSFEKIDYIYNEYLDGKVLSQRKINRAIKKFDASINSVIPALIPMLSELLKDNETFLNIINILSSKNVQSLKDAVDTLLLEYAFKDSLVEDLVGKLVGLLGGDEIAGTLATVIPLVENLLGIDISPAAFVRTNGGALSTNIAAAIAAAPKFEKDEEGNDTTTPHKATWSDVAKFFAEAATTEDVTKKLSWGLDSITLDTEKEAFDTAEKVFNAKKAAFVEILADLLIPLEGVLNALLRGGNITVLADENGENAAITIKGNNGYGNALYELFRILLNEEHFNQVVKPGDYAKAKGTSVTVSAITDAIFMLVDELCNGPIEYILTVLPKLAYALSSNGVEVIVSNLLSPVLAIYKLAEPVIGSLVEDLIGGAIGNTLKNFMPSTAGTEKERTVTKDVIDEETGEPIIDEVTGEKVTETVTETYMVYTIDEILGIAGGDGSNLISIVNELLTGLVTKDENGGEHQIIQWLPGTFFEDYAHHTITVSKPDSAMKWYYFYDHDNDPETASKKIAADDYTKELGTITDRKYVIGSYSVSAADSLIFILDTVLSPQILGAIAGLLGADINNPGNFVSTILNHFANGEMSPYVVADIIVKLFEGYEVEYPVNHDKLIKIDHSAYDTLDEIQKNDVDRLPGKLDSVVKEAIPQVLPIILDLLAPKADESGVTPAPSDIYLLLKNYAEGAGTTASLEGLVNELLTSFVLKNETLDMIMGMLVGLLGGEQVGGTLAMLTPLIENIAGINIAPQAFIKTNAEGNPVGKLAEYIGSGTTWAAVWANRSEKNDKNELVAKKFNWGINEIVLNAENEALNTAAKVRNAKMNAFIDILGDLLDPLFPVLQFILQGKKLSLFNVNATAYAPVDPEDKQSENTIGNGYLKITGLSAYEQVLLPIIYALNGTFTKVDGKGNPIADASGKLQFKDNIKTVEQFNNINNAKDMLSYLVNDVILALVNDLAKSPISFISNNIASLVYFLANDGVYNVVESALCIINVLLKATDAIYEDGKGLRLEDIIAGLANFNLRMLKLQDTGAQKGLLSTINDLIAGANLNLVLTQDLLLSLAGMLGDYSVFTALSADSDGALINEDNKRVDKTGTVLAEEALNSIKGTKTTITSSGKYVITGLLGFVLSYKVLGKLIDLDDENVAEILKTLVINLTSDKGVSNVVDVLVKLLNEYTITYMQYKQDYPTDKKTINLGDEAKHKKLNETLGNLDELLPIIFSVIPDLEATSLKDIVYPLFIKDDIANLLVGAIVKLLAGLPQETIDMVVGYVNQLTNLKTISVAPQAFAHGKFGSKLKDYIGNAKTWADVWKVHSHVEGNDRAANEYAWGIKTPTDFINLLSDFLLPLEDVLAILLRDSKISAFKEINVTGGDGYNQAIIPLLELLGIMDAKTRDEFNKEAAANGSINYILTRVFARLDEILENPIDSVLSIFANLAFVIGNDGVETFVYNLLAPINELISVIDPILPIAISVNLANIGTDKPIADVKVGEKHPGVKAGITVNASGEDIKNLINSILGGIMIGEEGNQKPLGIKLDINWLELAAKAAAEDESNKGKIKFTGSKFTGGEYSYINTKGEKLAITSYDYKNVVGDPGYTLVAVLEAVLTEENFEAIKGLLGMEEGFGEPLDSIINEIINNPVKIIELLEELLSAENLTYIPIQNRYITPKKYNYAKYQILTEQNADLIAANLDKVISDILVRAGYSSLKSLVYSLFVKDDTANSLVSALVKLLAGLPQETIDMIVDLVSEYSDLEGLSLSPQAFAKAPAGSKLGAYIGSATTWAEVWNAHSHVDGNDRVANEYAWGITKLDDFLNLLADIVTPLNCILELLLIGEGKELNVADLLKLKGANGYDYAIIPILEAFGRTNVLTLEQYKARVNANESQLIGYILEQIGAFADYLLDKPVDRLLEILPNVAYFISNEGIFLAVRNLVAPIYSIAETVAGLFGINIKEFLNISKLLNSIAIGDLIGNILGAKYDLRVPEIDFYTFATEGGAYTEERATARSLAANSFEKHVNPYPYIDEYNNTDKYDSYAKKSTQTYVVADKGDTLTAVLTWVLDIFGDQHNREALVNWLGDVFMLDAKAKAQVRYGVNNMFNTCDIYGVSELIVGGLFQIFGIAIVIDAALVPGVQDVQTILEDVFKALASNKECEYSSIAEVMEKLTGIWNKNIGTDDELHDAEEEVKETLNWFQRIIQKIRDFFRKLFGKK